MYLEKMYTYGDTIEIQKTYSKRYGHHGPRGERKRPSKKSVEDYNDKMAVRELARTIKANFERNDIHLVLTYKKDQRPEDVETAAKQRRKFLQCVKKLAGDEFKYISATSIGSHGAIHHHLIISYVDPREIKELWQYGSTYTTFLDGGDYTDLARYILHQRQKSAAPENLPRRRWSSSRNVARIKPDVKVVKAKKWREPPLPRAGYIVDVDSIESSVNPVTGIPYLYYRLKRVKEVTRKSGKSKGSCPSGDRLGKQKKRPTIRGDNRKRL